jgi:Eukaryotic translation initiation factor 4E binding protein (EIF4EBP)
MLYLAAICFGSMCCTGLRVDDLLHIRNSPLAQSPLRAGLLPAIPGVTTEAQQRLEASNADDDSDDDSGSDSEQRRSSRRQQQQQQPKEQDVSSSAGSPAEPEDGVFGESMEM